MKHVLWGVTSLVLLVGAGLWITPQAAFAATPTTASASSTAPGFNVITSSLPIKITTAPGKTITEELRIKNLNSTPQGIQVGLMKFAATGASGTPDLYPLAKTDTYGSWFSFSPSQFVAQPDVWVTVTMTINIPSTADLGYYLAVTFSPAQVGSTPGKATLKGSAATLVLLNVSTGNEKRSLQLSSFKTEHSLYEYLPANFNITVHNNGNIYLAPSGNVFITKGSKPVATLDLNDAGGSVLPNSNRVFTTSWTDGFPVYKNRVVNGKPVLDGSGNPKQDLKWDFTKANKFRFGHYTAKALVVYDDGTSDVPMEASLSFWVVPWKLIVILIVVLLLIGFGIFSLTRSLIRKAKPASTTRKKTAQAAKTSSKAKQKPAKSDENES